ncbi:MAG: alkaline phosphatase [Planctomycetota bacterium]
MQCLARGQLDQARAALAKPVRGPAKDTGSEQDFVRMLIALRAGDLAAAEAAADAALAAGLPFDRLRLGPREWLRPLQERERFAVWRAKREPLPQLVHGPMVGAVTDHSARVWVRTAQPAVVSVTLGRDSSGKGDEAGDDVRVQDARSSASTDFTAVVSIAGLAANRSYPYKVWVDGVPAGGGVLRTFPTAGKAAQFTVAFGGGAGFVPAWERMWDVIRNRDPLAMLMLGDNVYIDQPEHVETQRYCYYRRQSRPEWRRLTAQTSMFAIYDDHDFGTNDCVPGESMETPAWKRSVWQVFCQNWVNPSYGGGAAQPGCWFESLIGDVQFFFLDGRYYRDRKAQSMLGAAQKKWLLDCLQQSTATFKVIATPVPVTAHIKPGSKDPWDGYPEEREQILSFVAEEEIDGVFWISGDRHRTDVRRTARSVGYDVVEWTSSKLTNRHTHKVVPGAGLVKGFNRQCSFALMHFDTTQEVPTVRLECVALDGKTQFESELKLSELQVR